MQELKMFETIASKKFVVAFDDAYYAKRHTNDSYINMQVQIILKKLNHQKTIKVNHYILKLKII